MAYQPGYNKGATFKLDGANAAVTLNIRSWSWEEHVARLVTTHTGTNGNSTCIRGVLDGEGNVEANVDAAALVNAASPGVVAGAKGTITYNVGGTNAWSAHVLVTRLSNRSAVDGLVGYQFSVAMDDDGNYARPS